MITIETLSQTVDPLAKALGLLQSKVGIGQTVKLSLLTKKKDGESALREAIMTLIDAGWCEYEFTNDYSGVRRLDLPDFAKDYFKQLEKEYEQIKHKVALKSEDDSGAPIKGIDREVSGDRAA